MSAENMKVHDTNTHTHAGWVRSDIQWGDSFGGFVTCEMADMRGRKITFKRLPPNHQYNYDWFDGIFYWASGWLEHIHELPHTITEDEEEEK